jgi:pyruvyltransferase
VNTLRAIFGAKPPLVVMWPHKGEVRANWGDKLNPWLVSRLSRRKVLNAATVFREAVPTVHAVIGSHIAGIRSPNTKIFGAGFIRRSDDLRVDVEEICAVRGPYTAEKLRKHLDGRAVPIGDPALLMPLLYQPKAERRYRIGIIAHFREQRLPILEKIDKDPSIKLIDVTDSIEGFCDEVYGCETIVSSSLHGAILAHAYGIPASIVSLSDLPAGDGLKFLDDLSSIGLTDTAPRQCTTRAELLSAADAATAPRTLPCIERLLNACPFIDLEIQKTLISKLRATYPWARMTAYCAFFSNALAYVPI